MSDIQRFGVDAHCVVDQLLALFEAHGIAVRSECLEDSAGGLCRINKAHVLILNRHAAPEDVLPVCARALQRLVDLDTVYLRPEVRALVEHTLQNRQEV